MYQASGDEFSLRMSLGTMLLFMFPNMGWVSLAKRFVFGIHCSPFPSTP